MWQFIFAAGAVCTLGIMGVNRYARCPAKRIYGRLGFGIGFSAWTHRIVSFDDFSRRITQQCEDPDLEIAWRWFNASAEAIPLATKDPNTGRFIREYQENISYTEEDKRLISQYFYTAYYGRFQADCDACMQERDVRSEHTGLQKL